MMCEKWAQKFHTDEHYYPDLVGAFDWLKQIFQAAQPIKSIG